MSSFDTWRVLGVEVGLREAESAVRARALEAAGIGEADLRGFRIARRSLDARRAGGERRLRFVIHADLLVESGFRSSGLARAERAGRVVRAPEPGRLEVERARLARGPARGGAGRGAGGALRRADPGPERRGRGPGRPRRAAARARPRPGRVPALARSRIPRATSCSARAAPAPTPTASSTRAWSTRSSSRSSTSSVACGAPDEIRFDARAHVGTDRLHKILPRLRARLEALGVRFHWRTRVDGLRLAEREPGRVIAPRDGARRARLRRARARARPQRARHLARARGSGPAARGEALPARRAHRAPAGARRPRPPRRGSRSRPRSAPPTTHSRVGPATAPPARTASACVPAARSWPASPRRGCSARTA